MSKQPPKQLVCFPQSLKIASTVVTAQPTSLIYNYFQLPMQKSKRRHQRSYSDVFYISKPDATSPPSTTDNCTQPETEFSNRNLLTQIQNKQELIQIYLEEFVAREDRYQSKIGRLRADKQGIISDLKELIRIEKRHNQRLLEKLEKQFLSNPKSICSYIQSGEEIFPVADDSFDHRSFYSFKNQ